MLIRRSQPFYQPFGIWLLLAAATLPARSQSSAKVHTNNVQLQSGLSLRTVVEFGGGGQHPTPVYRVSVNLGVGSVFINDWLYPSINQEFELYNGGLGSKNRGSFFSDLSFDAITALTVTAGLRNVLTGKYTTDFVNRNIPLYYFGSFVQPALQNPFGYSLSLGTNLIFTPDKGKQQQRVGFINVHVGRAQIL